jgi:hypothetical protein
MGLLYLKKEGRKSRDTVFLIETKDVFYSISVEDGSCLVTKLN